MRLNNETKNRDAILGLKMPKKVNDDFLTKKNVLGKAREEEKICPFLEISTTERKSIRNMHYFDLVVILLDFSGKTDHF